MVSDCQAVPAVVELTLHRMRREMRSRWLQTACLNVIIATICYNPSLSVVLLQRPLADTGVTLLSELIRRWLSSASHLIGYVCGSHAAGSCKGKR